MTPFLSATDKATPDELDSRAIGYEHEAETYRGVGMDRAAREAAAKAKTLRALAKEARTAANDNGRVVEGVSYQKMEPRHV